MNSEQPEKRAPKNSNLLMIPEETRLKGYPLKSDADKDLKCTKWDKNINNINEDIKVGLTSNNDRALSGMKEQNVTTQKDMKTQSNASQRKPDWLVNDSTNIQMTSAGKKDDNNFGFHDSLDNFLFDKDENLQSSKAKHCNGFDGNFGNQKRGRRASSIKKEWLLTSSEEEAKLTGKGSDLILEDNWKGKSTKRERRRGQSLDDAADELKRLVEHNF